MHTDLSSTPISSQMHIFKIRDYPKVPHTDMYNELKESIFVNYDSPVDDAQMLSLSAV